MYSPKLYFKDFFKTFRKVWGNRSDGFPLSGIYLFSGGQGSGKTLNMIQFLLDVCKKYPDVIVVSNMDLEIPNVKVYRYSGLEDFETYQNGTKGIIYVLDEIQTLYSSMQSKGVKDDHLYIWSQNRKNRRVILGTTQRFTRVAKPIREQVRWHYRCAHFLNIFFLREYDGYEYDDNGDYNPYLRPSAKFSIPSAQAYDSYDTRQIIKRAGGRLDA